MREQKVSVIPVINEDGTLHGTLSAGDIASYSLLTIIDPHIDDVPLYNVLSVLEGKILNEDAELFDCISGNVVIALPQSCDTLLFNDPDSIVLCGDQPDMVERALKLGVNCIVLCQTEAKKQWLEKAGKTCIVSTPFDAARVAKLIYQAIPISRPCHTEDTICFHLSDYIDDVREEVLKSRYRCYPVLDENEKVVGTLSRYHLLRPRRKRVVLVDHNEKAQAVAGLEQAEILEIIDHHRLADIQTAQPIRSTALCPHRQWQGLWRRPYCPTPLCSNPRPARSVIPRLPSVWRALQTFRLRHWERSCFPARPTQSPYPSLSARTSRSSISPDRYSASVRSRLLTRRKCSSAARNSSARCAA